MPDSTGPAWLQYYTELRRVWTLAGGPSSRTVARQMFCSHTTVNEAVGGRRLVSRELSQGLFSVLGGERYDLGVSGVLWDAAHQEMLTDPDPGSQVMHMLRSIYNRLDVIEGKIDGRDTDSSGMARAGVGDLVPHEERLPDLAQGESEDRSDNAARSEEMGGGQQA